MLREISQGLRIIGYNKSQYLIVTCLLLVSSFLAVLPIQFLAGLASELSGVDPDQPIVNLLAPLTRVMTAELTPAGSMIVYFLVSGVLADSTRNFLAFRTMKASHQVSNYARLGVANAALRRDWLFSRSHGDLRSKAIDAARTDVERIQILTANLLLTAFSDVLDLVFMSLILLVMFPWQVVVVLLVCLLPLVALSYHAGRLQRDRQACVISLDSELARRLSASITGLEITRSSSGENHEYQRIAQLSQKLHDAHVAVDRSLTRFYPISGLLKNVSVVAAIAFYVHFADSLNPGDILLLFGYSLRFYAPVSNYINYYKQLQIARASLNNVKELVSTGRKLPEAIDPTTTFINIVATGRQLRHGKISLQPGDRVLVRGASGAGKTTLLRHVAGVCEGMGFSVRETTAGNLSANGYEIRGHSAMVSQNPSVLNLSLMENVCYPTVMSEADVDRVQGLLKSLSFSDEQIQDSRCLSELNFPGGEQRRLALARAIYSGRQIMLFDEVETNLDMTNRILVRDAIQQLDSGKIVFIAPHGDLDFWSGIVNKQITPDTPDSIHLSQNHVAHDDTANGRRAASTAQEAR